MEQNVAIMSKKIWNIIRVAILMIRKGLCKKKILMDLNMMMKRGKIAGKALANLIMFHSHQDHHNIHRLFTQRGGVGEPPKLPNDAREYEFSCNNTPFYQQYFANKRKNHQIYIPSPLLIDDIENTINFHSVNNTLDIMKFPSRDFNRGSVFAPSPALMGQRLAWSPRVQQLKITDSPFPMNNVEYGDIYVDQDAEDFIKNFYSQLKQQK